MDVAFYYGNAISANILMAERVFHKSNENIKKAVEAYEKYKKACKDLETAKKSHIVRQYVTKFTQKYFLFE